MGMFGAARAARLGRAIGIDEMGGDLPAPMADPGALTMQSSGPMGLTMPLPRVNPSFMGQGGAGRAIAGHIGDALLRMSGSQPIYQPFIQRQQELEQENAQWTNRLAVQDQLARARYKWEQDNKRETPNDTERDYAFWQSKLSPEEFAVWRRNRIDPPRWVQGADGRWMPLANAPQVVPAPPGVTFTPIDEGGPGPQAPGGFR